MVTPRPRPQVVRLTDAAAERIKYVMANATKPVVGVRVGVKNAGCAGQSYTLDYLAAPIPGDDHVNDHGLDVYIEPRATLWVAWFLEERLHPRRRGLPRRGARDRTFGRNEHHRRTHGLRHRGECLAQIGERTRLRDPGRID